MTLSTDGSAIVASIPVHEGEAVTKGQILFSLDERWLPSGTHAWHASGRLETILAVLFRHPYIYGMIRQFHHFRVCVQIDAGGIGGPEDRLGATNFL